MLKAIVCEDNDKQRNIFTSIIENTIMREQIDAKVVLSTSEPMKVLEYINNNLEDVYIYFLDIDLNCNINGIKLAERIREMDKLGFIVFVTTHSEMSFLTFEYKVEAMDYIIKDDQSKIKERINSCLLKAYERSNSKGKDDKIFSLKTDDKIINIKYSEILFFETSDTVHKVKVHELNRLVEFYSKLKDIEIQLDERFYRCHRACIVNKDNIKEIDKKNKIIYMINGETCFASSRELRSLVKYICSTM